MPTSVATDGHRYRCGRPVDGVAPFLIDAEVELALPKGSRVVLVSDLHLPAVATPTSTAVADEIAERPRAL